MRMSTRTPEDWRRLAACVVVAPAETLDAIAAVASVMDEAGAPCGIWHAAAVVGGYLDRCSCYPCRKPREDAERAAHQAWWDRYFDERAEGAPAA